MTADKGALRRQFLAARSALSAPACFSGSAVLTERLQALPIIQEAQSLMVYLAVGREVSLDAFITWAWAEGKIIYVPRTTAVRGIMDAVRLDSFDGLVAGPFGIREPQGGITALPEEIDGLLVPGVAFDRRGGRLGMGGGYYDRFLAQVPVGRAVGIGWECQLSTTWLPMEPTDRYVDYVVTEKQTIRTRPELV